MIYSAPTPMASASGVGLSPFWGTPGSDALASGDGSTPSNLLPLLRGECSIRYLAADDMYKRSSLLALYPTSSISDDIAPLYGHQMRTLFHAGDQPGRPLNTYVNYAYGDESTEMMYGGGWRERKLRDLKEKWDPHGRFGWYHPIR